MADRTDSTTTMESPFAAFFDMQGEAMREMFGDVSPQDAFAGTDWSSVANRLQALWLDFVREQSAQAMGSNPFDPAQWMTLAKGLSQADPMAVFAANQKLVHDSVDLWQNVLGAGMTGAKTREADEAPALPHKDRRFADPAWRDHPAYALLHQTYLMLAEYFTTVAREMSGVSPEHKQQLAFATQALVDAMSPDNFLLTNPVVLQRTIETKGDNLVKGMKHLINDLQKGQLTHTDADAFTLGENLAATPGKVVHETPLYQLIQYSPTTDKVLATPMIIFPPWINRFYILDLTPKKSFIRWAVEQGITIFVVSWKSADASMKDVIWDDYIRSQIEAIDHVRARLDVPAVHTIGYCVAGTTLAATLAILHRRGEQDKVASATFFTAQVDFEKSGDLKHFIDDGQLSAIGKLSKDGYLDGRYLAATFNALRGKDLIWNYVVNNYLLGQDYPAFDLLHWNGDVTNLPAKWHSDYLRDLYRDNKLVQPDALSADGTPIDLTLVETPVFIQAGKEDHIAPAESVWRMTRHFKGDTTFMLAGSGHIAGVVNPPEAGKYQYWVGDSSAPTLKAFVDGATEHPGSWWPHWLEWLHALDHATVPATGKRKPGGKGDTVIEDAPGRYVKSR